MKSSHIVLILSFVFSLSLESTGGSHGHWGGHHSGHGHGNGHHHSGNKHCHSNGKHHGNHHHHSHGCKHYSHPWNKRFKIRRISNLRFGRANPGAPTKTIAPGNSENRFNASFSIRGRRNRSFGVILPNQIFMRHRSRAPGPRNKIRVSNFQSNPSGNSGSTNYWGRAKVFVGATRDPLHYQQRAGRYRGRFHVTVVF